jgi:hypothetical protein
MAGALSLLSATGAGGAMAEAGLLYFGRIALQGSKQVLRVTEPLLLGLSFNPYRLRHRDLFSRMSTQPDNSL